MRFFLFLFFFLQITGLPAENISDEFSIKDILPKEIPYCSPANPAHGYCEPNPRIFRNPPATENATPAAEVNYDKSLTLFDHINFRMEQSIRGRRPTQPGKMKQSPFSPNLVEYNDPEPVPGRKFLLDRNGELIECKLYPFKYLFKVYDLDGRLMGITSVATFSTYDFQGIFPASVREGPTPILPFNRSY